MENSEQPKTMREIKKALDDKCYEIFQWSQRVKECATADLPNGEPVDDFDGAFSALSQAEKACQEARVNVEEAFNYDPPPAD